MIDQRNSVSSSHRERKRSLFSARKVALMASVVTGLAVYGFSSSSDRFDIFSSAAHAQVSNAVSSAAQPIGFADMVEQVKPSVISVKVTMKERASDAANKSDDDGAGSPMERFFRQFGGPDGLPRNPGREGQHGEMMGQGSGFFVSSDGYAVTNNHVVDGADKVEVTTDAGKTYTAKVIGTDPRTDVALIKVEGGSEFPFAKLSEGKARIGDWVLAVGNPFGLGGTVTAGIVSASGRDIGSGPYDDFIQIDAPVNKGNSGGPAFNMQGRGRRRKHCDLFAIRRQRRHSIFDPGVDGKERDRSTQGQGKRQPRLDRCSDSAGNPGYRRQHGFEAGGGRVGS